MSKADRAEELFRMGYNCSQSVYAAFAEEIGISIEEAAKKPVHLEQDSENFGKCAAL